MCLWHGRLTIGSTFVPILVLTAVVDVDRGNCSVLVEHHCVQPGDQLDGRGCYRNLPRPETMVNPWTPPTRTQCGSTVASGASVATRTSSWPVLRPKPPTGSMADQVLYKTFDPSHK